MKQEFKPLSWKVKNFDINKQAIVDYNVLKYRENFIKKLKKKCATKEEFAEKLRREFQWMYWSRSEHELIIKIDDDGRVWLEPWCGCKNPEDVKIDVTDDNSFDWKGFATYHISKQICDNKAKIDVYDQLKYIWDDFITYLWVTRLKWERKNPKFDK